MTANRHQKNTKENPKCLMQAVKSKQYPYLIKQQFNEDLFDSFTTNFSSLENMDLLFDQKRERK